MVFDLYKEISTQQAHDQCLCHYINYWYFNWKIYSPFFTLVVPIFYFLLAKPINFINSTRTVRAPHPHGLPIRRENSGLALIFKKITLFQNIRIYQSSKYCLPASIPLGWVNSKTNKIQFFKFVICLMFNNVS